MNLPFEFSYPWAFVLLLPLLFGILYALFRKDPALQFPSLSLFSSLNKQTLPLAKIIPILFYSIAGILIIFALSGPKKENGKIQQKFQGIDIILAVDLSGSMEAYDPDSTLRTNAQIRNAHRNGTTKKRIEYSKIALKNFVTARSEDRIGLIAFADQSYSYCPPTLDHSWLQNQISNLQLHTIGEGTGLAAPIASAIERSKGSSAKRKILVLFTDGANTVQNKITPMQAANAAKEYGLKIYTVGIGSPRGYVETPLGLSGIGNEFDEPLMRKIAETTGGEYYSAQDANAMKQALDSIDKIEKKSETLPVFTLYEEWASNFAGLAAIFLILGYSLSKTFFLRLP